MSTNDNPSIPLVVVPPPEVVRARRVSIRELAVGLLQSRSPALRLSAWRCLAALHEREADDGCTLPVLSWRGVA